MPPTTRKPSRTIKAVQELNETDAETNEVEQEPHYKLIISVSTVRETHRIDYNDVVMSTYLAIMNGINSILNDPLQNNRCIQLTGSDGIMQLFTVAHIVSVTPALTLISN